MPFPQRAIPTRTDIEEVINNNANPNVLAKAAVSNMIGLMQQMNELSKYASELMGAILVDTNKISGRIKSAKKRVKDIEKQVPGAESRLVQFAPSYFYDAPYTDKEYLRKDAMKGLLFRRDRSEAEVNRRRNLADPLPGALSFLDRFSKTGPCVKLYSDSDFFLNEWLEAEKARADEERKKRKAKRAERKAKRAKKPKDKTGKLTIMKVQKKQYSALGAEYQVENTGDDGVIEVKDRLGQSTDFDAMMAKRKSEKKGGTAHIAVMSEPQILPTQSGARSPKGKASPGGGASPHVHSATAMVVTGPASTGFPSVPINAGPPSGGIKTIAVTPPGAPPVQAASPGSPRVAPPATSYDATVVPMRPPPMVPVHTQQINPDEVEIPRDQWTVEMRLAESRRLAEIEEQRQAAIQEKLKLEQEKAKKMVPTSRMGILAGIKSGVNLRRAEPVQRTVQKDARTNMLDALKDQQARTGLRRINTQAIMDQRKAEREKEAHENTIYAALNARRHVLAEDSDDDISSSGEWDSD